MLMEPMYDIGNRHYGINWRQVRITSLGRKHNTEGLTYPVSFVYIKSTRASPSATATS